MTTSGEIHPTPRVLELSGVGKTYGSEPAVHALADVDLALERGEWLSITGPSGAGKSTLLNVLGCLDHETSGTYLFDGIDTAKLTDGQRAGLRSQRIGFVFQSFHLLPYRTVLENVMLAEVYRKQPAADREARARVAIERVGLSHRVDFLPGKLSGGEQQRVAIARALVGSPSLLLCDEPTGNLDSKTSANLLDLFEKLNKEGLTLVVVTHDENVANRAGRRVHIIDGTLTDITAGKTASPPTSRSKPQEIAATVARSGITIRDLFNESLAGMFARPGRMMLTVLGVVIGLTALVATLGLSRTANNRIISQFDQVAATELIVTARPGVSGFIDPKAIPWDAPERLHRLNGVVAAGTMSEVDIRDALVSSSPVKDMLNQNGVQNVGPRRFSRIVPGRSSGPGNRSRARLRKLRARRPGSCSGAGGRAPARDHGAGATACHLHRRSIVPGRGHPARCGAQARVTRLGDHSGRNGPPRLWADWSRHGGDRNQDRRGLSHCRSIAHGIAARRPADSHGRSAAGTKALRDEVQSDVNKLFLLLGALSLVVGAIGIANITLVSVMERTGEIGLRRAIGATRWHIAAQFLFESASMGIIGGILGASLGVMIVVAVSAYELWTPVLDPWAPFLAPVIGGAIGLLSGAYPALRAAYLEPVEAFRK